MGDEFNKSINDIFEYLRINNDSRESSVLSFDISARILLEFRKCSGISKIIQYLENESYFSSSFRDFLCTCCNDRDFLREFLLSGGHSFLRRSLTSNSPNICEFSEAIVSTIVDSEGSFPIPLGIIEIAELYPTCHMFNVAERSVSIYLRAVSNKMHGVGQFAVGYVMWSSSVILSRYKLRCSRSLYIM